MELCTAITDCSPSEVKYFLDQGANPNQNIASHLPTSGPHERWGARQSEDSDGQAHFTAVHLCILKWFSIGNLDFERKLGLLFEHNVHDADLWSPIKGVEIKIPGNADPVKIDNKKPMEFLMVLKRHYNQRDTLAASKIMIAATSRKENARQLLPTTEVPQAVFDTWKELLFSEAHGSDVLFVCPDGTELHAHTNVLSAASRYFRTFFTGSFWGRERNDDKRVKTDNSSAVMKATLRFIYTGVLDQSVTQDSEQLVDLLKVSHEYELAHLVSLCETHCIPKLDLGNVAAMLSLAALCDAKHLLAACLSFMKDSGVAENPTLCSELRAALLPNGSD